MRQLVNEYCARIGKDRLLVQGAGGNISWKDGHSLFIKASGKQLSEAENDNLFVCVDLPHLQRAISQGAYDVVSRVLDNTSMRPSIETLLHALLPGKIVLHLHPVEVLTYLVQEDFEAALKLKLEKSFKYVAIEYCRPGATLAQNVHTALKDSPEARIVFLQNHGIVIGGETIEDVDHLLQEILKRFSQAPQVSHRASPLLEQIVVKEKIIYRPIEDVDIQQLALNETLFERLIATWPLFPDHVVFLGSKAHHYLNRIDFFIKVTQINSTPEVAFIKNSGVFVKKEFTSARLAQLLCCFDVLVRLPSNSKIRVLNDHEISELVNWDAEKHRVEMTMQHLIKLR